MLEDSEIISHQKRGRKKGRDKKDRKQLHLLCQRKGSP